MIPEIAHGTDRILLGSLLTIRIHPIIQNRHIEALVIEALCHNRSLVARLPHESSAGANQYHCPRFTRVNAYSHGRLRLLKIFSVARRPLRSVQKAWAWVKG